MAAFGGPLTLQAAPEAVSFPRPVRRGSGVLAGWIDATACPIRTHFPVGVDLFRRHQVHGEPAQAVPGDSASKLKETAAYRQITGEASRAFPGGLDGVWAPTPGEGNQGTGRASSVERGGLWRPDMHLDPGRESFGFHA